MPALAAGAELTESAEDGHLRGTLMMAFQVRGTMFRGSESARELFKSIVSPPFARTFNEMVRLDPGCPEHCEGFLVGSLLVAFDANEDGMFTAAEISASSNDNLFFGIFFPRDTDLLFERDDGALVYRPGRDAVEDHIALHLDVEARPIEIE